jgi:poly [ADP-ribose] polymerase
MLTTITIKNNQGSTSVEVEPHESDILEAVGKSLLTTSIPNFIEVHTEFGDLEYDVKARGSYIEGGVKKPSMFVTERFNSLSLPHDAYKEKYLTCIHPESNNYKYYKLIPDNMYETLQAEYGRIGSQAGEAFGAKMLQDPYPLHLFWIKYYEKLSKGYIDQTKICLSEVAKPLPDKKAKAEVNKEAGSNTVSAKLFRLLAGFAKHMVQDTLISSDAITIRQVQEARKIFNEMCNRSTVKGFNTQLEKLLVLSPRRERDIRRLFAEDTGDFAGIIDREENLLLAMEGMAGLKPEEEKAETTPENPFGDIEVFEATDKQKEQVMKSLSPQLQPEVLHVYRIIPHTQQARFNAYLKENNITTVKQLWHGSRNENWLSIVKNSLMLHPNAVITGKMFGDGIYFAPSSMKSWGYTSYYGTRWARGNSSTAFMGVYATAYGDPKVIDYPADYTQRKLKAENKNCVHAKAGSYLMNDEIVFYDERAIVLNYLVEFRK